MSSAAQIRGHSGSPALECRDLSCDFYVRGKVFSRKKRLRAVQDVNLRIGRGEVLGIVGESGCGKSTLAKLMLGIHEPSHGEVLLEGVPIATIDRKALGRRIQPVFQDPYASLNPRKRISQIISMPLIVHGLGDRGIIRRRVCELMDLCGLPNALYHSYPSQLSGGQRQRVAIARALAVEPAIVICDEPTSALDVSVQAQILSLLKDLRTSLGLTYVLISHNLAVIEHICDRVAVMYLGRLVELGAADRVFEKPLHPYTKALLDANPRLDAGGSTNVAGLPGAVPDPLNPPPGCQFHPRCSRALPGCRQYRPPTIVLGDDLVECSLHGPARDSK